MPNRPVPVLERREGCPPPFVTFASDRRAQLRRMLPRRITPLPAAMRLLNPIVPPLLSRIRPALRDFYPTTTLA